MGAGFSKALEERAARVKTPPEMIHGCSLVGEGAHAFRSDGAVRLRKPFPSPDRSSPRDAFGRQPGVWKAYGRTGPRRPTLDPTPRATTPPPPRHADAPIASGVGDRGRRGRMPAGPGLPRGPMPWVSCRVS